MVFVSNNLYLDCCYCSLGYVWMEDFGGLILYFDIYLLFLKNDLFYIYR